MMAVADTAALAPQCLRDQAWSATAPDDLLIQGDIVVDRSFNADRCDEPESSSSAEEEGGGAPPAVTATATATATAEEAALAKRLDALDATLAAEAHRLWKVRAAMDELKTSRLGLKPSQAPTGLPIAGIVEALSGADDAEKAQEDKKKGGRFGDSPSTQLLCDILAFLPLQSRAALRVASKGVRDRFKGALQVVSTRVAEWRSKPPAQAGRIGAAASATAASPTLSPVHYVEVKPLRYAMADKRGASFAVYKRSVKVCSLKPNDEVFFRPAMSYLGGYDQAQDWPRGRILDWRQATAGLSGGTGDSSSGDSIATPAVGGHVAIRPDGFVMIKTWSWRMASGEGATVIARWSDVRRARVRAKYQMLPEQRVWRAQELKDQAKLLFEEAAQEEKGEKAWRDFEKEHLSGLSGGTDSSSSSSSSKKSVAKAGAAKSSPAKKKTDAAVDRIKKLKNSALVFLKPEVTGCGDEAKARVLDLVRGKFEASGLAVTEEGQVSGEVVARQGLIDTHYGAIATKAVKTFTHQLELTLQQRNEFQLQFGLTWYDAIKSKQLVNAQQASDEVKQLLLRKKKSNAATTAVSFGEIWDDCTKVHNLGVVKLGGGFYIGKVLLPATLYSDEENDAAAAPAPAPAAPAPAAAAAAAATAAAAKAEGGESEEEKAKAKKKVDLEYALRPNGSRVRYVVNGFYPKMREPFIAPAASVHFFVVEWDNPLSCGADATPPPLSWQAFREDVLGATSPSRAKEGSLRRSLYDEWESLGLKAQPGISTNGIHASASPFEALAEKINWVGAARAKGGQGVGNDKPEGGAEEKTGTHSSSSSTRFSVSADAFGGALLGGSLNERKVAAWCKDPVVTFEGGRTSLFDLLEGLDAPACLLKARAIASDAHGKLDAAKGKYLEAVGMVEGDSIFDPDGTSRKVATQKAPCGIVQAGMVELKVTSYTAIALCCKKLVQVIDGLPVVVASKNGKLPKGPESNADKMKLERALRVRVELVSDIVAFGLRAASVVGDLEPASASKRDEIIREIEKQKNHSVVKFFCLMRSKALFFAAGALLDPSCPNRYRRVDPPRESRGSGADGGYATLESPIDKAVEALKAIRLLHDKYVPTDASKQGEKAPYAVPEELRNLIRFQRRDTDKLLAFALAQRKKQNKKGQKLWAGAFAKNSTRAEDQLDINERMQKARRQGEAEAAAAAVLGGGGMPVSGGVQTGPGSVLGGNNGVVVPDLSAVAGGVDPSLLTAQMNRRPGGTGGASGTAASGAPMAPPMMMSGGVGAGASPSAADGAAAASPGGNLAENLAAMAGGVGSSAKPLRSAAAAAKAEVGGAATAADAMSGAGMEVTTQQEEAEGDIVETILGAAALGGLVAALGLGAMYLLRRKKT